MPARIEAVRTAVKCAGIFFRTSSCIAGGMTGIFMFGQAAPAGNNKSRKSRLLAMAQGDVFPVEASGWELVRVAHGVAKPDRRILVEPGRRGGGPAGFLFALRARVTA